MDDVWLEINIGQHFQNSAGKKGKALRIVKMSVKPVSFEIILIVNMPLADVEVGYNKAVMELKQLEELLRNGEKKNEPGGRLTGEVTPLFNKEQFCNMVEKAKHHIREGDIFQIVLSNRLSAPFEGSLFNTYRFHLPEQDREERPQKKT